MSFAKPFCYSEHLVFTGTPGRWGSPTFPRGCLLSEAGTLGRLQTHTAIAAIGSASRWCYVCSLVPAPRRPKWMHWSFSFSITLMFYVSSMLSPFSNTLSSFSWRTCRSVPCSNALLGKGRVNVETQLRERIGASRPEFIFPRCAQAGLCLSSRTNVGRVCSWAWRGDEGVKLTTYCS